MTKFLTDQRGQKNQALQDRLSIKKQGELIKKLKKIISALADRVTALERVIK